MIRTQYGDKVINALAALREAAPGLPAEVRWAVDTLDNAGVFADLDEQTDYAPAIDILAESARRSLEEQYPNILDPAEWGDTTTADVAERQMGRHRRPVPLDEPLVGDAADEMREGMRALGRRAFPHLNQD